MVIFRQVPGTTPYGLRIIDSCLTCHIREEKLFCDLQPDVLVEFDAIKHLVTYPKGAVLFLEGQAPRGAYVVCSGKVKLSMTSREGRTLIVRVAECGDVLGLTSVISGEPYNLTAETQTVAQLNFVTHDDFLSLIRKHPEMGIRVARELSRSYHAVCRELRLLGLSESVTEKAARLFLEWARTGDTGPGNEVKIRLSLTHEEIAQHLSTSRETVSRVISHLKQKKVITLKGSVMTIRDMSALQVLAGS